MIARHLLCSLKKCLATKCNSFVMTQWLPALADKLKMRPNVVIIDFVEQPAFTESIIRFNYH